MKKVTCRYIKDTYIKLERVEKNRAVAQLIFN